MCASVVKQSCAMIRAGDTIRVTGLRAALERLEPSSDEAPSELVLERSTHPTRGHVAGAVARALIERLPGLPGGTALTQAAVERTRTRLCDARAEKWVVFHRASRTVVTLRVDHTIAALHREARILMLGEIGAVEETRRALTDLASGWQAMFEEGAGADAHRSIARPVFIEPLEPPDPVRWTARQQEERVQEVPQLRIHDHSLVTSLVAMLVLWLAFLVLAQT